MSQETRSPRRLLRVVRRYWAAIGAVAVLGLLAGAGYAALSPPMPASSALVVLPPSAHDTATQVAIASSRPVLAYALRSVHPAISLQTAISRVQVMSVTANILSISAQGSTAAQAEGTANAVASPYVTYVRPASSGAGNPQAQVLETATKATGTPLSHRLLVTAGLGALLGALIGAIGAIALSRGGRRLTT